jgi:GNAT superfamily N-acetyltransferase
MRALGKLTGENLTEFERIAEGKSQGVTASGQPIHFKSYLLYPSSRPGLNEWIVEAYTVKDGKPWLPVGTAEFVAYKEPPQDDSDFLVQTGLKGWQVNVDPEHQHQGLATAMYDAAEKAFKMPIHSGDFQTPAGHAFLHSRHQVASRYLQNIIKKRK